MNIDLNFEKRGRNAHKYRELMKAINSINNSLENKSNLTLNSPRSKYSFQNQLSQIHYIFLHQIK